MKRFTAILLALLLIVSLSSCKTQGGTTGSTDTTGKSETAALSDKRFSDSEILAFTHSDGTLVLEPEHFVCILPDGSGEATDFSPDVDYSEKFKDLVTPYGVTVGENVNTLVEKVGLETGFAAYVEKGAAFQRFDTKKGIDIKGKDGGCIYFGFARDKEANGKWAFAEYGVLTQILQGKVVIDTQRTEFDLVISYAIFDGDGKIQQFVTIYGDINLVMSLITA